MDLAYLWVFCHDIPKAAIQREHAYQMFTMAGDLTTRYFDVIPNTPTFMPKTGDLGILGTPHMTTGVFLAFQDQRNSYLVLCSLSLLVFQEPGTRSGERTCHPEASRSRPTSYTYENTDKFNEQSI